MLFLPKTKIGRLWTITSKESDKLKKNSTIRIAVTGANGFIGKYVLSELSNHPVDVVALVRKPGNLNLQCSEILKLDINNPPTNSFDVMGRPDVLIHLAWGGLSSYHSLHHFEQELPMQYFFLKDIIRSGLPALVVSGTCFEYGMQSGQLSEEQPTYPNCPYGYAKDALHRQLLFLQKDYPIDLTWARLFYLYGEGQTSNSLLPLLESAITRREKIFNMSGGEQLRDYLHVTEVAKYIVMIALHKTDMDVLNICSGKPISIRSIVETWIKKNQWKINLNLGYYKYPENEPMAFWGDRSRLNFFQNSIKEKI